MNFLGYIKVLALLSFAFVSVGFVLPALFSAAHTELVIVGYLYIAALPVAFYYGAKSTVNTFIKKEQPTNA